MVDPKGRTGGLCLLWSSALDVKILEFNANTIAITIKDCSGSWTLIGFYGPPYHAKRAKARVNLHALLETINGLWVCCGDFNVVIDDAEKEGGKVGGPSTPSFLRDLLFELGAVDLGFSSNRFTWSNRRWGRDSIRERLDRAIAKIDWHLTFPKANMFHLGAINLDHSPLLLDTNPEDTFSHRLFCFEVV
jgi:hypothetical protein